MTEYQVRPFWKEMLFDYHRGTLLFPLSLIIAIPIFIIFRPVPKQCPKCHRDL